jgi:hypothetical protein
LAFRQVITPTLAWYQHHLPTVLSEGALMSDTPPDRLSNDPQSPFYDEAILTRGIGIRFKGAEKNNVEEYCVSEGWVRVAVGKTVDRRGKPLTMKVNGPVEPYFRDEAPG